MNSRGLSAGSFVSKAREEIDVVVIHCAVTDKMYYGWHDDKSLSLPCQFWVKHENKNGTRLLLHEKTAGETGISVKTGHYSLRIV
jgi:hypothetical protein